MLEANHKDFELSFLINFHTKLFCKNESVCLSVKLFLFLLQCIVVKV